MLHLDLFSGIGGFALAVDRVWPNSQHIFCDNDKFCQQIIKQHWPDSPIISDIRQFTADTFNNKHRSKSTKIREKGEVQEISRQTLDSRWISGTDLLTGGFPCQPFSQAGRRRGTADDRYLWPEMLRVIQLTKPTWIIGENVGGFVTWNEGMVLEQVCLDLESENYEVQTFVIPAVSVNAPHRRDRVWIVANKPGKGLERGNRTSFSGCSETGWDQNWIEVATRLCRVDDGIPRRVDRLKALGNSIVPQVAEEIMKAIKLTSVSTRGT